MNTDTITLPLDVLVRMALRIASTPAAATAADGIGWVLDVDENHDVVLGYRHPDRLFALLGLQSLSVTIDDVLAHVPGVVATPLPERMGVRLSVTETRPVLRSVS